MLADIRGDRFAHLIDRFPPAAALREFVRDLGLLLHANLFQRDVVFDRASAKLLVLRVLGICLLERRGFARLLAAQRFVQLGERRLFAEAKVAAAGVGLDAFARG